MFLLSNAIFTFSATKILGAFWDFSGIILKCILIVVISGVLIKVLNSIIEKIILTKLKFEENKISTLNKVTSALVKVVIYFIAICSILSIFGINIASIIAVAGIGSIAVGFAAQNLVRDFITGAFIILENQYNVGDLVEVKGLKGTVENITMRITNLRAVDGSLHYVPNGEITTVTNFSKGFSNAIITVGVDYSEDVDRVIAILKDEMKGLEAKLEDLLEDPEVLGVSDLGDNSVDILVVGKTKIGGKFQIERDMRRIIKNRLDKENISIPFPQRVVHMAAPK